MPKNNRFNEVRAQSTLGTRWLWFYTRIILLLSIISSGLMSLSFLTHFFVETNFTLFYIIWNLAYYIVNFWLARKAYLGILKFTVSGYMYNQVYLYVISILSILTQFISLNQFGFNFAMISGLICTVAFLVPNLIYFHKRKSLFGSPSVDAEIHEILA